MHVDLGHRIEAVIPALSAAHLSSPDPESMAAVAAVAAVHGNGRSEAQLKKLRASIAAKKNETARVRAATKSLQGIGEAFDALIARGLPSLNDAPFQSSERERERFETVKAAIDDKITEIENAQKLVVAMVTQVIELLGPLVRTWRKANVPATTVASNVFTDLYNALLEGLEVNRDFLIALKACQARLLNEDDEVPPLADEREMKAFLNAAWA